MSCVLLGSIQARSAGLPARLLHTLHRQDSATPRKALSPVSRRRRHECIGRSVRLPTLKRDSCHSVPLTYHRCADNLDHKLEKYMKKYFSKEVKEKQRANEIERGIEDYGPGYTHQECVVM